MIKRFNSFVNEGYLDMPEVEYQDLLSMTGKDIMIICVEGMGPGNVYIAPGQDAPASIDSENLSKIITPMKNTMFVIADGDAWSSLPASDFERFSVVRTDGNITRNIYGNNFYRMEY